MLDELLKALDPQIETVAQLTPRVALAVAFLLGAILAGALMAHGLSRLLTRARYAGRYIPMARRLIRWVFGILGFILALQILGLTRAATSLLATGGLLAIILGFAFREIGENLLAGVFLAFSRSFDVGDLIESGGLSGVVRAIDLRDVHIRTADGRDIYIPSAQIFKNPLVNYTRDGLRRAEFTIGLDYAHSPAEVRRVMLDAIAPVEGVLPDPEPGIYVHDFEPQYVSYGAYFWVNTFVKAPILAEVRSRAMDACHRALAEGGFNFSSQVSTALDHGPIELLQPGTERGQEEAGGRADTGTLR